MKNRQFQRIIYTIRNRYATRNNLVLALAIIVAISWSWASVQSVERNYGLQKEVDDKNRQKQLIELQTQNLAFEQHYFQSREYQALEVKRRLGLAETGEKVLVLPPNSTAVIAADKTADTINSLIPPEAPAPPALQQWLNFMFGGSRHDLQNKG